MREKTFANLKEFNEFLHGLNPEIPPVTADMLPDYSGGTITAIIKGDAPEGFDKTDFIGSVGVADEASSNNSAAAQAEAQLGGLAGTGSIDADVIIEGLHRRLEHCIEMSVDQLAVVTAQRDAEIADHEACHAEFEATYNRDVYAARIKGYAEAISAGYFPGHHIMSLPQNQRDMFYQHAREAVERIVAAEVAYESRHGATQH